MIERILDKLFRREDIGGVEDPYLTRWHLLHFLGRRVYLHWFRQSDNSRCVHDHPCDVLSFVFRGSYLEYSDQARGEVLTIIKAPSLRRFRAEHKHRIELTKEQKNKTWSLCLFFPKRRDWGFWVSYELGYKKWIPYQEYFVDHPNRGGCE